MIFRKRPEEKRLAAFNMPPRSALVFWKCIAILGLAIATVVVVGGNRHVFGPPLIALLLTAIVAAVLVSFRPRILLASIGAKEQQEEQDLQLAVSAESLFLKSPSPGLLVDGETREILAANTAAEELYGYASADWLRLPWGTLLFPDVSSNEGTADMSADGLARHQRADGNAFWADLQSRPIEFMGRSCWLLTITDVSSRMHLVEELESSERRALDLVELSLGVVFSHDLDGSLRMVNPAFVRAIDLPKEELIGRNLAEFLRPGQQDAYSRYLSNLGQDDGRSSVVHLRKRDGGELTWEFRNCLRVAVDGRKSVLCCAIDISERNRNERRLLKTNREDPLTGCYNRRHLPIFEEDADPAARWAAIVIDIDFLKRYNDTHGHRVGDQAIVATARMLKSMVRDDDSVVRLGGDEFAILLRQCDQATLESFALRLQRTRENQVGIPFTFGMAMRKNGEDLDETIHRADRQLIERRVIERSSIRINEADGTRPREPRAQRLRVRIEADRDQLSRSSAPIDILRK